MKYIDEKFKEASPIETVEKIKDLLRAVDIEVEEKWHDSGVDNCWSLSLAARGGAPTSNGKGVSKELARASAYAEFIERIQGGLSFFKYQDIIQKPEMYIQNFAPDVKYMTAAELEENGEWMDYLVEEYGGKVTRKTIADFAKLYGCSNDKIATLPFYSLFEDKYVYLPIGFVDQIYGTNGCCAGNTRDEAWVHALSEIMERRSSLAVLTSGKSAPTIPQEVLDRYPVVKNIINQIMENGKFDLQVLDYSLGSGFPIVATRLINKENQSYLLNVAADPVLEIAIQRTLTEMLQGRNIKNFSARHSSAILNKITDFPIINNVLNQLETSNGIYTADFFAEEITCKEKFVEFEDNSNKTNSELLEYVLNFYKKLGKPVYVRNFSYLGFQSYRFVVPGFSEAEAVSLQDLFSETLQSQTGAVLRNPAVANAFELSMLLNYSKSIESLYSRYLSFSMLSGVPVKKDEGILVCLARSYAAYKIKSYSEAVLHINKFLKSDLVEEKIRKYFTCFTKYLSLIQSGISQDKVRVIIYKFFEKEYADELYGKLDNGLSPYDGYLLKCDLEHCEDCKYKENCLYEQFKEIIAKVGKEYSKFTDGQDRKVFEI